MSGRLGRRALARRWIVTPWTPTILGWERTRVEGVLVARVLAPRAARPGPEDAPPGPDRIDTYRIRVEWACEPAPVILYARTVCGSASGALGQATRDLGSYARVGRLLALRSDARARDVRAACARLGLRPERASW